MDKQRFFLGQHVRWNDPGLHDYDPSDWDWLRNRIFEIDEFLDDGEMVHLSEVDGHSEAEAFTHELEPIDLGTIQTKYNKIKDLEFKLHKELRHILSPILMDTDEDNPIKCDVPLERDAFGISTLEMPHVTGVWQDPTEGWIYFDFDCGGPCDFDDMDIQDIIDVINAILDDANDRDDERAACAELPWD